MSSDVQINPSTGTQSRSIDGTPFAIKPHNSQPATKHFALHVCPCARGVGLQITRLRYTVLMATHSLAGTADPLKCRRHSSATYIIYNNIIKWRNATARLLFYTNSTKTQQTQLPRPPRSLCSLVGSPLATTIVAAAQPL